MHPLSFVLVGFCLLAAERNLLPSVSQQSLHITKEAEPTQCHNPPLSPSAGRLLLLEVKRTFGFAVRDAHRCRLRIKATAPTCGLGMLRGSALRSAPSTHTHTRQSTSGQLHEEENKEETPATKSGNEIKLLDSKLVPFAETGP